jgi:hypothetical protein
MPVNSGAVTAGRIAGSMSSSLHTDDSDVSYVSKVSSSVEELEDVSDFLGLR